MTTEIYTARKMLLAIFKKTYCFCNKLKCTFYTHFSLFRRLGTVTCRKIETAILDKSQLN